MSAQTEQLIRMPCPICNRGDCECKIDNFPELFIQFIKYRKYVSIKGEIKKLLTGGNMRKMQGFYYEYKLLKKELNI